MTTYTLTITNQSGAAQTVAVFQVNSPNTGSPLVWLSQLINNQCNYSFTWDTTWALGFGSTSTPLNTGVTYTSNYSAPVQPTQADGENALSITYPDSAFAGSAYYNPSLDTGVMQIITDTSFTVTESLDMSVAVYMYGIPILASQGAPNSQYEFYSDTLYYLTVSDYPVGSVLPSFEPQQQADAMCLTNQMSSPTQFDFASGVTSLSYTLSDELEFVLNPS